MNEKSAIRVQLGERSYSVRVSAGLMGRAGELVKPLAAGGRCVVLTDSNVRPLCADAMARLLEQDGLATDLLEFPAGEQHKTLATYTQVIERVLSLPTPVDRRTLVLAVGGGVVTDVAGFVAATCLRGLDFVSFPTTLLAAVDASVGGKTGVDTAAGKNLVGAFHQPRGVFIDPLCLRTLPPEELRNGLAECVKHAAIAEPALLDFIEAQAEAILAAQPPVMGELILRNVAIKAKVVSADEREAGPRANLNYGHTVGHAIETAAGFSISHGQAVSLGMMAAGRIAAGRGLLAAAEFERMRGVLVRLGLPVRFGDLPGLPANNPDQLMAGLPASARDPTALTELMRRDKKARAGTIRFVLLRGIGRAAVFDDVSGTEIEQAIRLLA